MKNREGSKGRAPLVALGLAIAALPNACFVFNGLEATDDGGVSQEASSDVNGAVDSGISYVQGQINKGMTQTLTVQFEQPIQAGSTLIVAFDCDLNRKVVSVSDALGNPFERVAASNATYDVFGFIYAAQSSKAASDSVSVALDGVPDNFEVFIHEYAGLAPPNPDSGKSGGGTSLAADGTSVFLDEVNAPALIFAYGYALTEIGHGTIVNGSNMTKRQGVTGYWAISEDQTLLQTGSVTATAQMTSGMSATLLAAAFAAR